MFLRLPPEHLDTIHQITTIRHAGGRTQRLTPGPLIALLFETVDKTDDVLTTNVSSRLFVEGVDAAQRGRVIARMLNGMCELDYATRPQTKRLRVTPTEALAHLTAAHNNFRRWLLGENGVNITNYRAIGLVATAHNLQWVETAEGVGTVLGIHPTTVVHRGLEMAGASHGVLGDVWAQERDFIYAHAREATPPTAME